MPEDYVVVVGGEHKYRFIGGPIELPDKCGDLLSVVGLAAASWARMEQHIDAILIQVNKEDHSDEVLDLYDPRHPGTFDAKLKMLRRYFRTHPALASHKEAVLDCATGLKRLSQDRNELLHGVLEDYSAATDDVMINGSRFFPAKGTFLNRHQRFPVEKLRVFTRLVNMAHYKLCGVSKELFTLDAVAQLRRPQPPVRRMWQRLLRLVHG